MIAQVVIFSLAYLGKGGKVDMWYNGKISIREKLLKKCRRNDVTYYRTTRNTSQPDCGW